MSDHLQIERAWLEKQITEETTQKEYSRRYGCHQDAEWRHGRLKLLSDITSHATPCVTPEAVVEAIGKSTDGRYCKLVKMTPIIPQNMLDEGRGYSLALGDVLAKAAKMREAAQ